MLSFYSSDDYLDDSSKCQYRFKQGIEEFYFDFDVEECLQKQDNQGKESLDSSTFTKSFGSVHGYWQKIKLLSFDIFSDFIDSLFYRDQFGFDPCDGIFCLVSPISLFFVELIEYLDI